MVRVMCHVCLAVEVWWTCIAQAFNDSISKMGTFTRGVLHPPIVCVQQGPLLLHATDLLGNCQPNMALPGTCQQPVVLCTATVPDLLLLEV